MEFRIKRTGGGQIHVQQFSYGRWCRLWETKATVNTVMEAKAALERLISENLNTQLQEELATIKITGGAI